MHLKQLKQELRRRIRAEMKNTEDAYFVLAGREICHRILNSDAYRHAKTVFCFVSHGKEPDTSLLLEQALLDGKILCVPLCKADGGIEARRIHTLDQLSPGVYGIPEPPADAERFLPAEIDLSIIPCLAATRDGRRLGKGGGYYDRFLSENTGGAVLVCPERFLLWDIPTEGHDIPLPNVVTE